MVRMRLMATAGAMAGASCVLLFPRAVQAEYMHWVMQQMQEQISYKSVDCKTGLRTCAADEVDDLLQEPGVFLVVCVGPTMPYSAEERKCQELMSQKHTYEVAVLDMGTDTRVFTFPEYLVNYPNFRLALPVHGIPRDQPVECFRRIQQLHNVCQVKAKYAEKGNPAPIQIFLRFETASPGGPTNLKTAMVPNPDTATFKHHLQEAMRDPWSAVRESLVQAHRMKNLKIVIGAGNTEPVRLEVTPTSSQDAKKIGSDCITGKITEIIEKNLQLPGVMVGWTIMVENFDKQMWSRACAYLEKNEKKNTEGASGEGNPEAKVETETGDESSEKSGEKDAFSMLTSGKHSWYDWYIHMRGMKDPAALRNEKGETLLHVIAQNLKESHLQVLFYLGVFGKLKDELVDENSSSEFPAYTARGIAERFSSKSRGIRFMESFDMFVDWEESLTFLQRALRKGEEADVEVLLESDDHEVERLDYTNSSCLYWACIGGKESLVRKLESKGLKTDHVNTRGESILHAACKLGHSHLIPLLYQEYQLDPARKDTKGMDAFDYIAENGDTDTVKRFLEARYGIPGSMLPLTAYCGHVKLVDLLINKCGVKVSFQDPTGKTALLRAADGERDEVVMHLLEKHNANINDQDRRERNILHFLVEHRSNLTMRKVLDVATARGKLTDMINVRDRYIGGDLCFLLKGKDNGRRAWHYIEVRRWLVELFMKKTKRGRVDVQNFGNSIVSGWGFAPRKQDMSQMESVFDERKRNLNQELDSTPLHYCVYMDNAEMAKMLLEAGADPNIKDSFGQTTVHLACMRGNLEMLRLLEHHRAKLDVADNDNKRPANVAEINEQDDVVDFLKAKNIYPVMKSEEAAGAGDGAELTITQSSRRDRTNSVDERDISTSFVNSLERISEASPAQDSGGEQGEEAIHGSTINLSIAPAPDDIEGDFQEGGPEGQDTTSTETINAAIMNTEPRGEAEPQQPGPNSVNDEQEDRRDRDPAASAPAMFRRVGTSFMEGRQDGPPNLSLSPPLVAFMTNPDDDHLLSTYQASQESQCTPPRSALALYTRRPVMNDSGNVSLSPSNGACSFNQDEGHLPSTYHAIQESSHPTHPAQHWLCTGDGL